MPREAHVRDGGTSLDGVSRARLNKLVRKQHHREGMRKLWSIGSPNKLDPLSSGVYRPHFLQVRWRDPDRQEDLIVLQQIFKLMHRHEVDKCIAVLREFSRWRLGPGDDLQVAPWPWCSASSPSGAMALATNVRPDQDAGFHVVSRNVRRCIEASRAHVERSFTIKNDDDNEEETLSIRSTAIQAPILRTTAQRHTVAPAKPVHEVLVGFHELIQEVRHDHMICDQLPCNSNKSAEEHKTELMQTLLAAVSAGFAVITSPPEPKMRKQASAKSQRAAAAPFDGPFRVANADSTARLLPGGSAHFSSPISSSDLLDNLFRQTSSQQTRGASSLAKPRHPPATLMISGGPIRWSKPSAEDIINASSARVELLCAKLCCRIR